MECVFGLVGNGFAIVAADSSAVHSILVHKSDEDKIMVLDSHKLVAASGEPGDRFIYRKLLQDDFFFSEIWGFWLFLFSRFLLGFSSPSTSRRMWRCISSGMGSHWQLLLLLILLGANSPLHWERYIISSLFSMIWNVKFLVGIWTFIWTFSCFWFTSVYIG